MTASRRICHLALGWKPRARRRANGARKPDGGGRPALRLELRPTPCTLYRMGRRKHIAQPKWTADERTAFGDGVRTRASTVPDKRKRESKRACRQPVTDDTEK